MGWKLVGKKPSFVSDEDFELALKVAEETRHRFGDVRSPILRGLDEGLDVVGDKVVYWRVVDNIGPTVEEDIVAVWEDETLMAAEGETEEESVPSSPDVEEKSD